MKASTTSFGIPLICATLLFAQCFPPPCDAHGGGGGFSGGGFAGRAGGFGGGAYGGFGHASYGHAGYAGGHYGSSMRMGAYGQHAWAAQAYAHQLNQSWGSWARPVHWNSWYTSWGAWGPSFVIASSVPMYFNTANLNLPQSLTPSRPEPPATINEVYAKLVNADGSLPPARHYSYRPDDYLNVVTAESKPKQASSAAPAEVASAFRLGPDADILPSGRVVIHLTNQAYLVLTPKFTQLMDQDSGMPILSLQTDPLLIWHVQSEIKRQSDYFRKVLQKGEFADSSDAVAASGKDDKTEKNSDAAKVQKINDTLDLLTQASTNLGEAKLDGPPPAGTEAPVPDSIEILASVWLSSDGDYVIVKMADGSLAYMDGNNLYSDEGKTPLPIAYPAPFKSAIKGFLSGLIAESGSTRRGLFQDYQYGEVLKSVLKDKLKDQRKLLNSDLDPITQGTTDQLAERIKRLQDDLDKTERRLKSINSQLDVMPKEVSASRKLLKQWG